MHKKLRMMDFLLQGVGAYIVFVIVMYFLQDRFIYIPEKDAIRPEEYDAGEFERIAVETRDGQHLMLWWKPPLPEYPLILYFHGNAGHLAMRAEKLKAFTHAGFGVLGVSWRGYGPSTGIPSENGLYEDGRAALALAIEHLDIVPERVILYGESLGSGVAVHLGALMPVGLVVLEAPYTSVATRGQEQFPMLPVRYIIRSHFDSLSKIGNLKSPLLIIHGENDKVIPPRHGHALLEAAPEPKKGVFLPDVGHTDFPVDRLVMEVKEFAEQQGVFTALEEH